MSDPSVPPFSRAPPPPAPSYTLPSLSDYQQPHPSVPPPSLAISTASHAAPVPTPANLAPPIPSWQRPSPPSSRVFNQIEYPLALLARVGSLEEKLRSFAVIQEILADIHRRTPGLVTTDIDGRLVVPGRKRDADVITLFGFPKTDEDVEYCLEDTPGLSQASFMTLKNSLMDNLAHVRQAAHEAVGEVEAVTAQQLSVRIIPSIELERKLAWVVNRFCMTRKQIMHKYRGYVRNRRWIENVATRQRRGCLSHRQNNVLRLWLFSNFSNPYPDNADKKKLINQTQLSMTQINNWLINARSRVWKPTVETMSGERIRKELINKHDRYSDIRSDGRSDFDADYFAPPQNAASLPLQHNDPVMGPHVQPPMPSHVMSHRQVQQQVVSHRQGTQAPAGHVEGLAEDGTWLAPQTWGGLEFPADVNLNN